MIDKKPREKILLSAMKGKIQYSIQEEFCGYSDNSYLVLQDKDTAFIGAVIFKLFSSKYISTTQKDTKNVSSLMEKA